MFAILIIFNLILCCTGNGNEVKYNSVTIEKIVKKVCNITMDYVSNASLEEKLKLLKTSEEKLNSSAVSLGAEGHKYVKLLMHGVKLIAYNNTILSSSDTLPQLTESNLIERSLNETDINQRNSNKDKDQIIIDIANKIKSLAELYKKAAKTPKGRKQALETIKKKILKSANKKLLMHKKHDEVKYYSDIIAQGLDLMMKKNTRRMEIKFDASKDVDSNSKDFDKVEFLSTKIDDDSDCTNITSKICSQLTTLRLFTCFRKDISLPVEKLCNDISDCPDESDEKECVQQGTDKIHEALSIVSKIQSAPIYNCFVLQLGSSAVTRQQTDLRNFLDVQLTFIERYRNISVLSNRTSNDKINEHVMKKSVNKIAVVVSNIAAVLDETLCNHKQSIGILNQLGDQTKNVLAVNQPEKNWSTSACECTGMICSNISCHDPCPKICMQKNSLNRWICEATDGNTSVPVGVLCDGKIDCYHKTDETNCTYGAAHAKFHASEYFYDILQILEQKAVSRQYSVIQYKLLALHGSVKNLQKLSISKDIDNDMLKEMRDRCLSSLIFIYEYLLSEFDNVLHLDPYYQFLNALKDKLLLGLKFSNMGNEKFIRRDVCFCIADQCGITNCSKVCIKACPVHSKMTRYYCRNTKANTTIPIDFVCDGKSDCLNGEDELDCKLEVCRKHHLLLIGQSFESAGHNIKGTAAGEALLAWKSKANSLVDNAQKEKLSSPTTRKVVNEILEELVTAYGSIDDFRRSAKKSRQLLKQFIAISQNIINTVKNCGNKT